MLPFLLSRRKSGVLLIAVPSVGVLEILYTMFLQTTCFTDVPDATLKLNSVSTAMFSVLSLFTIFFSVIEVLHFLHV